MTNEQIKELALANGFKLKRQSDGSMDLNPYVYDFARALLDESVEWVSVDERLPESNGLYLLYLSDGMIVFDKFDADKSSFNNIIKDRLATHWQLLPQPPKEADDE